MEIFYRFGDFRTWWLLGGLEGLRDYCLLVGLVEHRLLVLVVRQNQIYCKWLLLNFFEFHKRLRDELRVHYCERAKILSCENQIKKVQVESFLSFQL